MLIVFDTTETAHLAPIPPICPSTSPRPHFSKFHLRLLPDLLGRLLQARVALLVRPPRAEPDADKSRPRPALEEEDGKDDAEAETEGRLDEEVGEADVPLFRFGMC